MFVNNRYIKNQYLQKAISVVYESLIQKDKHPLYVIFLSVKPEEIDVNIHPTKTEVKFHYEETIYEILKNVVMKTLSYVEYPKLDFDGGDENIFDDIFFDKNMIKDVSIESSIISNDINNNCNNDNIFNSCLNGEKRNCTQELISNLKTDSVIESQNTNFLQVKPYYILTTVKSGLLIINFHLAHVRILYEMYLDYTKDKQSQQLLFPIFVNVDSISYNNIKRNVDLFTNYGFSMEFKNNNSILITSSPIYFDEENIIDFFDDSFDILNISKECEHDFVLRLAQKSAINKNKIFTNEEMQVLINRLFSCKEHDYTPNGEKIWKILKSDDIERILR
jgi:DNA mismatch repair protein MutL